MFSNKIIILIIIIVVLFSCNNINSKKHIIEPNSEKDTLTISQNDSIILCNNNEDYEDEPRVISKELDSAKILINFIPKGNYSSLKKEIKVEQANIMNKYLNSMDSINRDKIIDSARNYITTTLLNKIFPFWYGTKWDFDGYTSKPNDGVIACGYFVSTTLRDVGFILNRYHLAQQSPYFEAITLHLTDSVQQYDWLGYKGLKDSVLINNKDGLYFVGLDNHVGFLWLNNDEMYFIHSNYIQSEVQFEYAETSEAFLNNEQYIIAYITNNDSLIVKWILNEEINVIKQ